MNIHLYIRDILLETAHVTRSAGDFNPRYCEMMMGLQLYCRFPDCLLHQGSFRLNVSRYSGVLLSV